MVEPAQRRLRKKVVGGMLASLLVFAALAFTAFWPAAVLGVNGEALQSSVDILEGGSCDPLPNDQWLCRDDVSYFLGEIVAYRVKVDSFGCWHAYEERRRGKFERSPSRSGCVRIANYLA
ncbi:MAG: hypothetical protein M3Y75_12885 [Actinomycetota bacterium]|nr:hypothetical protein [Actinomycetota bacterium]